MVREKWDFRMGQDMGTHGLVVWRNDDSWLLMGLMVLYVAAILAAPRVLFLGIWCSLHGSRFFAPPSMSRRWIVWCHSLTDMPRTAGIQRGEHQLHVARSATYVKE